MKTLMLIGLVALALLVSACEDIDLLEGHDDHDHDGDGIQDHAPEDHDDDHDHDGDGEQDHAPEDHDDHDVDVLLEQTVQA
jgi:ABC-type nickel/cobalt efflux system permease component RcnA